MKHEGKRKAGKDLLQLGVKVGDWYTNKTYRHKKKTKPYTLPKYLLLCYIK
jgi:hypothetical protein